MIGEQLEFNFAKPADTHSWTDGTRVFYGNHDAYDAWLESIGQKMPKPLEVIETRPGLCECGSTAAGSLRHSTWCPAFEK